MKAIIVSPKEVREIQDMLHRLAKIEEALGHLEDAQFPKELAERLYNRAMGVGKGERK